MYERANMVFIYKMYVLSNCAMNLCPRDKSGSLLFYYYKEDLWQ